MNINILQRGFYVFTLILLVMALAPLAMAKETLKPYVLASKGNGDFTAIVNNTRSALENAGFTIAGEYSPYKDAIVIIVTNDELKRNAAASKNGGFGAAQRVSVTKVGNEVQVAFTNPVYMANVYQLKGNLDVIGMQLQKALGKVEDFGAKGLTPKKLRKYHYMMFMPYFDDVLELKSFGSHDRALASVEEGLKAGRGGTTKVYRIDIPNSNQSVFGVAMSNGCSGDEFIMNKIDFAETKSTLHLPYEILVNGKDVIALPAEFRIAQSFPDLSMAGENSFFSIMCAPDEIQSALGSVVKTE